MLTRGAVVVNKEPDAGLLTVSFRRRVTAELVLTSKSVVRNRPRSFLRATFARLV